MSQGPNPPSRKPPPRTFRRQNSFAGFPSASLSVFPSTNNDTINTKAENNGSTSVVSSCAIRPNKSDCRHLISTPVSSSPSPLNTNEVRNSVFSSSNSVSAPLSIPSQSGSQAQLHFAKTKRAPSSKVFYSLPRHATTSSNPALLKESGSGLGLYLMSRNERNPHKTSAAEQLGVSPAKFLSLPRPVRKQNSESSSKSLVYRSLPRPHTKGKHGDVLSLPPSYDAKSRLSTTQINPKKMTRDPADGREADPKPRRRDCEHSMNISRPSSIKESDSFRKKEEIKPETESKIPKENDPKYHPRSRTVVKNDTWQPPARRDEYISYPYRRLGNEDLMYPPLIRPPPKEFISYYIPPRPLEPTYNFQSFPRTDREMLAYQVMCRRPDGTELSYPFVPRVCNYDKFLRPEAKPIIDHYLPFGYIRDYPLPHYATYQPLPREQLPNTIQTYHPPPPPLLPKGLNKPEPFVHQQYNKPIISEAKYQSLPRKSPKEVEHSYQSLPRRFGKENELRFYPITNIDNFDDPGYESLNKTPDAIANKATTKTSEDKNEINKKEGKENEPKYQVLPPKPDVVVDHTRFTFPNETLESSYQIILPPPVLSENQKTNSLPSKKHTRERSIDPKYQSFKRRDESKYQSLSRKSHRDAETRYQSPPKRKGEKEKDYDRPPPPLPKRQPREGEPKYSSTHARKTSKERDAELRHHSMRRTVVRDGDLRLSASRKVDKSSPATVRSCTRRQQEPIPSSQQPPRSPRWTHPDTDEEDGIYSTVKTKDDPVYQSVSDVTYTKPLPPVPAPSRYRRRNQDEEEDPPPPLPPPRLTTGPVGPHNPLLNSSIPNVTSTTTAPLITRPQILRTPSSSPENVIHKIPSPSLKPKEKEEEELYSSIPSPISSSHDSPPSSLPRAVLPSRVASSASWDSLGSSVGSSGGSSRNSSLTSGPKENNTSKRRRRAVSDPRMDAGVLHRLAFTVWHTALHIEKEV